MWRKSIFADGEGVGIEEAGLIGTVNESLQNTHVIPVVHGNNDLGFQLFDDLLGPLRSHGVDSSYGLEENIHMPYELELIFVEGFADIPGVKDAEAVHLKDESGTPEAEVPPGTPL